MLEPKPITTFDDLPDFLRRAVDQVADAIIKAGRSPAEAVEPARAVRKLFDQPGDALSAYSREVLDRAASLMEAEILRRVAAAHDEHASIVLTLDHLPADTRAGIADLAASLIKKAAPAEVAAEVAAEARRIFEEKMGALPAVKLQAIAATIVPADVEVMTPADLADLTGRVLPAMGRLVESEILRRVTEARGGGTAGTA